MIDSISSNFISGAAVALSIPSAASNGGQEKEASEAADSAREERKESDLRAEKKDDAKKVDNPQLGVKPPEEEDRKTSGSTGRHVDTYA
jgi:hypothetical protein